MIFSFESEHLMSDEDFRLLRDCVYGHCGIYFDDDSKYLLEKRLARRLAPLKLGSFRDYYQYLKYDRKKDQEMMDIMDVLTTNETYFFRESFQLKAFTDEIIPEIIKNKSIKTLRIWSAGCSSGEEPYSIAMLLHDIPSLLNWKIEIFGTDISQRVLSQARRAVYGKSSFRATDDDQIKRFFVEHEDGYKVCDKIKEMVTISHLNLLDSHRISMMGAMDIIFCRNVIIYFDLPVKKRVVESFHKSLAPGGFLLLGHSESLMNVTTFFTLRHFKNDMIYQRPANTGWQL